MDKMTDLSYKAWGIVDTTLALAGEIGKYASLLYGIAHVVGDKPDIGQVIMGGLGYAISSAFSTSFSHTFQLERINQEHASALARLSAEHSTKMTNFNIEHTTQMATILSKKLEDLEQKIDAISPTSDRH